MREPNAAFFSIFGSRYIWIMLSSITSSISLNFVSGGIIFRRNLEHHLDLRVFSIGAKSKKI